MSVDSHFWNFSVTEVALTTFMFVHRLSFGTYFHVLYHNPVTIICEVNFQSQVTQCGIDLICRNIAQVVTQKPSEGSAFTEEIASVFDDLCAFI